MQLWVVLMCVAHCVVGVWMDKCPDGETCPDQTTCCKISSEAGPYGCCPRPSAVCCSDGIHCCPSGSKCDVNNGTCIQQDRVLHLFGHGQAPEVKELPAGKIDAAKPDADPIFAVSQSERGLQIKEFRLKGVVCPDGGTECPSASTCCQLKTGNYGCCHGTGAVCCSDGVHCCPQGYTCDEQRQSCVSASQSLTFHWMDKKPVRAKPVSHQAPNITCLDRKTTCYENDTCCNATVGYGCCPLAHAVCCMDKKHCCPAGSHCDIPHERCYREEDGFEMAWAERRGDADSALTDKVRETMKGKVDNCCGITCPDGRMCGYGQTCCPMKDNSYACCSFANITEGQGFTETEREEGVSKASTTCPDGSDCPGGNTCCKLRSESYGCCVFSQAVCCSDRVHCCPQGYECDLHKARCTRGNDFVTWFEKQPAIQRSR